MRLRRFAAVVALCVLASQVAQVGAPAGAVPDTSWLDAVNGYRVQSGLQPVVDEPAWSEGIAAHLGYLALTPASLRDGQYASAHDENPLSPYWTASGAAAGQSANLGTAKAPISAVDDWMTAPFHAIGLLRPGLRRTAFGQLGNTVGIDVLRGIEPTAPQQVLFPGGGAIVDVTSYSGHESPSPLESCVDTAFSGLPIIAMLTEPPADGLTASLTTPDGTVLHDPDQLCVVTRQTYRSTDAVYGQMGHDLLAAANAVFVFPRSPLQRGGYTVALQQPGRPSISWQFGVGSAGSHSAFVGPEAPLRLRVGSPGSTVIGTLTVDGPLGPGFLTVYPCDQDRPDASSLNYVTSQTIANTFVAQVDGDGFVCVYAMSSTHVIVDVVGETTMLDGLHAPTRAFDTRVQGGRLGPNAPLRLQVAPPGSAVIGTVTVDGPSGPGYLTVYPCGHGRPNASTLNYAAGQTIANTFVSPVDADGFICIYAMSDTDVVVDVTGQTTALPGLHSPTRVVDTRVARSPIGPGQTLRALVGTPGSTVIGTLTVDGPLAAGFLTMYPCDHGRPEASSLNYSAGQSIANTFVTSVDADGYVCVYAMSATHVIIDITGETTELDGLHSPERMVDTRISREQLRAG